MNKNIKLAVAGAVLAMSATAANAGIIIPAGEWTLDINGNVNAFAIIGSAKDDNAITGGGLAMRKDAAGEKSNTSINTGLLPAWLGFTGTTRQNDTDVSFTISMQPNVSSNAVAGDPSPPALFRQANFTFGDKSWGSIKLGKDIGIFASNAILNDMTLLGVGGQGVRTSGHSTTLGGIGLGYIYAAWKGQVAYTTPNFNGFQVTVGLTNPNQGIDLVGTTTTAVTTLNQDRFGLEGQANYSFAADNFSGKIWVGGASYKVKPHTTLEYTASAADLGMNVNAGGVGVTAYYYKGDGVGTTFMHSNSLSAGGSKRDSDGGYMQLSYTLPTKTKAAASWGRSNLDKANSESASNLVKSNEMTTIGLYHPLTKHLNLVGEYSRVESENHATISKENTSDIMSVGGILFF